MAELRQYYKVLIQGRDITKDVTNISIIEEDGLFTTSNVTFSNGFLWLDVIGKGNQVKIIGGNSREDAELLFTGYVNIIKPSFKKNGDVYLTLDNFSYGHLSSGIQKNTVLYPMDEHPMGWAQTSPLWYSSVIEKVAIDNGYKIGNIAVEKGSDKQATFKAPLSMNNKSVWQFLTDTAKSIGCVLWDEWKDGVRYISCVSETSMVNTINKQGFYFLARKGASFSLDNVSDDDIQMISCDINIDTRQGKAHKKLSVKADPKTGADKITTDTFDEKTGEWTKWSFNEALLAAEPESVKDAVFKIVTSSSANLDKWGVIKKYFVEEDKVEEASQEPLPETFAVTSSDGGFDKNKQYETLPALGKIPPEDQTDLFKRATSGKLTDEDFNKYFKAVDKKEVNKKEKEKEDDTTKTAAGGSGKKKRKTRRDEGFHVTAKAYGNNSIRTKGSYVVSGIGKYSAAYYLYRITRSFSAEGYRMTLTFTK